MSFFLPMLIMVNTYVLTIRLLKRKAKLCQKESATLQHQSNEATKPCIQCKVLGTRLLWSGRLVAFDNPTPNRFSLASSSGQFQATQLHKLNVFGLLDRPEHHHSQGLRFRHPKHTVQSEREQPVHKSGCRTEWRTGARKAQLLAVRSLDARLKIASERSKIGRSVEQRERKKWKCLQFRK